MNFQKSISEKNKKIITIFKFNFNKKQYELTFRGQGRRVQSFEWLLKSYPNYFNVHDETITKKYKDSNKAVNEFIKDEGFDGFVLENKINASNNEKVNSFKLDLEKICKHMDRGGIFTKQIRKQPNSIIKNMLLERSKSRCEITGYKLSTKNQLREKNIIFLSKMLEIVFDHRIPLFKGGSDDSDNIKNWQILSWYVNNEKNKICKNCYENDCYKCALAFPEKTNLVKPINQNLKDLFILKD